MHSPSTSQRPCVALFRVFGTFDCKLRWNPETGKRKGRAFARPFEVSSRGLLGSCRVQALRQTGLAACRVVLVDDAFGRSTIQRADCRANRRSGFGWLRRDSSNGTLHRSAAAGAYQAVDDSAALLDSGCFGSWQRFLLRFYWRCSARHTGEYRFTTRTLCPESRRLASSRLARLIGWCG